MQEDGWFKTSSTATIWMAASRVRRSRTVFQSDRSLQAARMESAWRGDSGLPAPIRPLKLTPSVRAPARALAAASRLGLRPRPTRRLRRWRIPAPRLRSTQPFLISEIFDFFRLAGTVRFERRDGEVTRVRREGLQAQERRRTQPEVCAVAGQAEEGVLS